MKCTVHKPQVQPSRVKKSLYLDITQSKTFTISIELSKLCYLLKLLLSTDNNISSHRGKIGLIIVSKDNT